MANRDLADVSWETLGDLDNANFGLDKLTLQPLLKNQAGLMEYLAREQGKARSVMKGQTGHLAATELPQLRTQTQLKESALPSITGEGRQSQTASPELKSGNEVHLKRPEIVHADSTVSSTSSEDIGAACNHSPSELAKAIESLEHLEGIVRTTAEVLVNAIGEISDADLCRTGRAYRDAFTMMRAEWH